MFKIQLTLHTLDHMTKTSSCPEISATVTRCSPEFSGGAAGNETKELDNNK